MTPSAACPQRKPEPQRNRRDRGVALEGLRQWDDAIADYKAVLKAAPNDPSAWNNLGNPNAALGRWDVAEQVPSNRTLHAEHNRRSGECVHCILQGKQGAQCQIRRMPWCLELF